MEATIITLQRDVQCPICSINYRMAYHGVKADSDNTSLGGTTVVQQTCVHPTKIVLWNMKSDGYVVQLVKDLPKKIYIEKTCGDDCDCSCNDYDD